MVVFVINQFPNEKIHVDDFAEKNENVFVTREKNRHQQCKNNFTKIYPLFRLVQHLTRNFFQEAFYCYSLLSLTFFFFLPFQ